MFFALQTAYLVQLCRLYIWFYCADSDRTVVFYQLYIWFYSVDCVATKYLYSVFGSALFLDWTSTKRSKRSGFSLKKRTMSGSFLDNFKDKGKDKEGKGGFYSMSEIIKTENYTHQTPHDMYVISGRQH